MKRSMETVRCETPTPGKAPTNIPKWKYEIVRDAIVATLEEEQEVYFADLPEKVGERLNSKDKADLGSIAWHVTTVKLHMETKGLLRRLPGKGRQRLALA
ncbi:MAG: hypothetical protein AAF936_05445 [Pseudomonadota bacterium]